MEKTIIYKTTEIVLRRLIGIYEESYETGHVEDYSWWEENYKPALGLFYAKASKGYTAVFNLDGCCWTEDFDCEFDAIGYLAGWLIDDSDPDTGIDAEAYQDDRREYELKDITAAEESWLFILEKQ